MTTRHFYYLTVIADMGNLSAAAEKLQISQPALSKFLTEYETSLGLQIFISSTRNLVTDSAVN
mgnify:CR=1 FL=1